MTGDLPYRGTVWLNGRDTSRMKPWELSAIRAVLPQSTVLAFPFTVAEVVRLGVQAGVHAADRDAPMAALSNAGNTPTAP